MKNPQAVEAELIIARQEQFRYFLIPFRLFINGRQAAVLMPGESVHLAVEAGKLTLQVRMSFYRSAPLELELEDGEAVYLLVGLKQTRKTAIGRYFETLRLRNLFMEKTDEKSLAAALSRPERTEAVVSPGYARWLQGLDILTGLVYLAAGLFYRGNGFAQNGLRLWLLVSGAALLPATLLYFRLSGKSGRHARGIKKLQARGLAGGIWLLFLLAMSVPDVPLTVILSLLAGLYAAGYFVLINRYATG